MSRLNAIVRFLMEGMAIRKRCFDFILVILSLLMISPVMVVMTIVIWLSVGRPIFFRQMRPGYMGRPFKLYKFRTMTNESNANGDLLPDEKRITRLGNFLRCFSLDELPELLNVLKGDMSLVGPRPLLVQYVDRYTPEQIRRHEVKPGLTGWAQVNGRNSINWEEKFKLDIWYVDHQSILLDLRIIWMTVLKVLKREGIIHKGQATMQEFKGTK
jgi:sugar transferase EpsL